MKHVAITALLLAAACGSDGDPAPSATVRSATPESLMPADDRLDDLTITIDYDDGDGDLGGGVAEIHDCRGAALVSELPIPAIAADDIVDEGSRITGTLELHVTDVGATTSATLAAACADLGIAEATATATVFCVTLVDAAGHRGDGDCTSAIAIQ